MRRMGSRWLLSDTYFDLTIDASNKCWRGLETFLIKL